MICCHLRAEKLTVKTIMKNISYLLFSRPYVPERAWPSVTEKGRDRFKKLFIFEYACMKTLLKRCLLWFPPSLLINVLSTDSYTLSQVIRVQRDHLK